MKNIIRFILAVIGIFLISTTIFVLRFANINFGYAACGIIGVILLIYVLFYNYLKDKFKILKSIIIIGVCALLIMCTYIALFGKNDTVTYKEDAFLVLGASVVGKTPTLPLIHRLDKAVQYHKKNPSAIIVVSGGKGFGEDITEALAMENYLISKGIDKSLILKEEKATSTYENFIYTKKLLDNHLKNDYTVAFTTNTFHIFRSYNLSKIAKLNTTHMNAYLEWYNIPSCYIRECAAIFKMLILRK